MEAMIRRLVASFPRKAGGEEGRDFAGVPKEERRVGGLAPGKGGDLGPRRAKEKERRDFRTGFFISVAGKG